MMQRRRFLLLAALSTLLLAGVVPAAADAQANPAEAQAFLTERHEALRTLFAQRASATRSQRLSTLVSELLDLEELSRRLVEHEAGPADVRPWAEVEAELRAELAHRRASR